MAIRKLAWLTLYRNGASGYEFGLMLARLVVEHDGDVIAALRAAEEDGDTYSVAKISLYLHMLDCRDGLLAAIDASAGLRFRSRLSEQSTRLWGQQVAMLTEAMTAARNFDGFD